MQMDVADLPICNFHKLYGQTVPAIYDGATTEGVQAYMCQGCFELFGLGLGMGLGQRLVTDGGINEQLD